ncbi:MAG: hypothetical protein ABSA75_04795 [Candidatus Bathyarchaeia archaeon]
MIEYGVPSAIATGLFVLSVTLSIKNLPGYRMPVSAGFAALASLILLFEAFLIWRLLTRGKRHAVV